MILCGCLAIKVNIFDLIYNLFTNYAIILTLCNIGQWIWSYFRSNNINLMYDICIRYIYMHLRRTLYVYNLHSTFEVMYCILYNIQCTLNYCVMHCLNTYCVQYNETSLLHNMQYTVYKYIYYCNSLPSVHLCIVNMYDIHCMLYTVHSTVHSAQWIVYSVHCTSKYIIEFG